MREVIHNSASGANGCFALKGFSHWWKCVWHKEKHVMLLRCLMMWKRKRMVLTWINEQLWLLAQWVIPPWTGLLTSNSPYLPLNTYHTDQTCIALINWLTTANATDWPLPASYNLQGTVWIWARDTNIFQQCVKVWNWGSCISTKSPISLHRKSSKRYTCVTNWGCGVERCGCLPGRLHYGKCRIQGLRASTILGKKKKISGPLLKSWPYLPPITET